MDKQQRKRYYWKTPVGVFNSLKSAAEANYCSKETVRKRCHNTKKRWYEWQSEEKEKRCS